MSTTTINPALAEFIRLAHIWAGRMQYGREDGADYLNADEVACLTDPERIREALEMVDDWQARCWFPDALADSFRELANEELAERAFHAACKAVQDLLNASGDLASIHFSDPNHPIHAALRDYVRAEIKEV